jgi:hypothetical protein
MARWFKRKPVEKKLERVLDYNASLLKEQIENLSSKLYSLKNEFSVHIIREVIDMARNVQILEVNRYRSEEERWVHKGRLEALSDLSSYIERSVMNRPVKEDAPKSRDAIRTRPTSSAGAAI